MTSNRQTAAKPATTTTSTTPASTDTQEPTTGRQGATELEKAVAESPLEAAPASQTDAQGTSFYNPALTGSGTIMPDGTYGAPLPDPNLAKREADPEITTELDQPNVEAQKAAEPSAK
jgi:hypothetical protein